MIRKHALIVLILALMFMPMSVPNARALEVHENDTFTINIHTNLSDGSGDYDEYEENEYDNRIYEVISVSDDVAEWLVHRNYSYHDSEGGYLYEETVHHFFVSTTTGQYLNNTMDSPESYRKYYKYDNIWFQIDPTLPVGSTVHILGYDYTVQGLTTVFLDLVTAVDVIAVSITNAYQRIYDAEYDPDGMFEAWFDETYYFDPETGYIVMYEWNAFCSTSQGNFDWSEVGVVVASSYSLNYNEAASQIRMATYIAILVGIIVVIIIVRGAAIRVAKKRVEKAIGIISKKIPPPKAKPEDLAPTLWNPLTVDHHELLKNPPETEALSLLPGVFITIEPDNRVALVNTRTGLEVKDVLADKTSSPPEAGGDVLKNTVYDLKEESMMLLYRLALGMISNGSPDYMLLQNSFPGIDSYIQPTDGIATSDPHAVEVFTLLTKDSNPELQSIIELMARRKILDYTLGQAPLSPMSHYKKLKQVLKYEPGTAFLVGDDDLLSISLARHGIEVVLVEIDPYTCALISHIAQIENLPIKVYQSDLRAPIPNGIPGNFDIFVADPDFTIEAFALFLARGLSQIRQGGIGLINYENSRIQKFMSKHLLERLNVGVIERVEEMWDYVIVRNLVPHRHGTGKYATVTYTEEVALLTAPFSSVMYVIERTPETEIILDRSEGLEGVEYSIYDF